MSCVTLPQRFDPGCKMQVLDKLPSTLLDGLNEVLAA